MSALLQNICIEQGADFADPFTLPQNSTIVLTEATALMQIRLSFTDPTALITLSTEDQSLIITGNVIAPFIPAAVTAALLPGNYLYDLKVLQENGRLYRAFQGTVGVSPQITIPTPPSFFPTPGQLDFSIAINSGWIAGAL